eukprot:Hpha_TRINITY_DN3849_c0_g1::TRINITY_DN3849_c0_g1_i2::g.44669::m.44669
MRGRRSAVWHEHHSFPHFPQWVRWGQRFGVGHVKSRAKYSAAPQGLNKSVGVHDAAPRDVHQSRGRLHDRQSLATDKALCLRRQRTHDHDVVRLFAQTKKTPVFSTDATLGVRLARAVVVQDFHAKPHLRGLGDAFTYPPHANDSQRRTVNGGAKEAQIGESGVWGGTSVMVRFPDPSSHGKQKCPCTIRNCLGEDVGGVSDPDTPRDALLDVDMVNTHTVVRNYPQLPPDSVQFRLPQSCMPAEEGTPHPLSLLGSFLGLGQRQGNKTSSLQLRRGSSRLGPIKTHTGTPSFPIPPSALFFLYKGYNKVQK